MSVTPSARISTSPATAPGGHQRRYRPGGEPVVDGGVHGGVPRHRAGVDGDVATYVVGPDRRDVDLRADHVRAGPHHERTRPRTDVDDDGPLAGLVPVRVGVLVAVRVLPAHTLTSPGLEV